MKHWGKPLPKDSKFPPGVGKTIHREERQELDRQAQYKALVQKHFSLPKMPNGSSSSI